jgi:hypothetical protein
VAYSNIDSYEHLVTSLQQSLSQTTAQVAPSHDSTEKPVYLEPSHTDPPYPTQADTANDPANSTPKKKIRDKTRKRAELFKSIKDKNPELTQEAVAMRAMEVAKLRKGDVYSAEDVRNAYRSMEWEWQKGERTR